MSEIDEEKVRESSLRDLYYVLFRHKWKMILFFFAVVITVIAGTFLCAEVYRSEAMLLVRLGRESVSLDPTATTGQIIQIHQPRESEINSELQILKSHDLLEKVVDSIGPEAFLKPPNEKLPVEGSAREAISNIMQKVRTVAKWPRDFLERLNLVESLSDRNKAVLIVEKDLEIEALKDSSSIKISYEGKSPKVAQDVVTQLIEFYLEKHINVYRTPGSYRFFSQQSVHLRDGLAKSEDDLGSLKNETGISSLEEQRSIVLNRIGSLEQEVELTEALLAASRAKVNTLKKTLQPTLPTEEAVTASLEAKVKVLRGQLADGRAELKSLNDSEIKIKRLVREIGIQEANYRKYSENREQARIDHALEADKISNISVVQPATLPMKPVRPRKALNLALAFLLGILGALGLAFFSEYLNHSIKTPEDVEERLQLPTLASILHVRTKNAPQLAEHGRRDKANRKAVERKPAQWNVPGKISKQYEVFMERLLLCSNGSSRAPYVLGLTGCNPREGVSTVAANLATALSRNGDGNVLLVDTNTADPSIHQIFKANLSPGLSEIVVNGQSYEDAVQSLPSQKLHILSAGAANGHNSEIFDSDSFGKLIDSVRNNYRFVVMDVPALNQTTSMASLASVCDGVILVIEAEQLRWEVAKRAKEQLVKANANVLGVVLNKRRFHIPRWLYQTL